MMIYFKRFVPIVFMLLFIACSARYETYYEFDDASDNEVKECVSFCNITKEKCADQCNKNGDLCKKSLNNPANMKNSDYVKEKQENGSISPEIMGVTHDPLQCVSIPCDCDNDYRTCYQMCGGKVRQKERCIANCPEP